MAFEEAVTSIILYLSVHCRGVNFRNFYIGRTIDLETTLYGHHNVSKEKGIYKTVVTNTSDVAAEVVRHFRTLGMEGDLEDVGKDDSANIVYCYLVTIDTKEIH